MQAEVLIVDDNKFNLMVLKKAIEEIGLVPVLAKSASEAIARFIDNRPELMVVDIHMPLMSGFQLLSRLAEFGDGVRDIPTIIVTGDTQIKDTSEAGGYHNINLVYKPIEIDDFIDLVRKRLGL